MEGNRMRVRNVCILKVIAVLTVFCTVTPWPLIAAERSAVMSPPIGEESLGRVAPLAPKTVFRDSCALLQTPHRQLLSSTAELALMRRCGEPVPKLAQLVPSTRKPGGPTTMALISNVQVNDASSDTRADQTTQSETTIVKDPVTGNLIVGWNDSGDFTGVAGNSFTGWGVSSNGGATWTDMGPLPPLTPNDWSLGDPSLAVHHASGSVYFATLACSAAFCNLEKLQVAKSTDGGLTWPQRVNPVVPAPGEVFDLHSIPLRFQPNGNGAYDVNSFAPPFDTDLGTNLGLSDDSFVEQPLGFTFPFHGVNYTSVFVGSNGYVTFGGGDTNFIESVGAFVNGLPRIAALWDDLNPGVRGGVFFKTLTSPNRAVITWSEVPEFFDFGTNTVQVTLFESGEITMRYNGITLEDALVGIGPGAVDPTQTEIDFSQDLPQTGLVGHIFELFAPGITGIWDKELIAVDNSGGPHDGNVYLVATDFFDGQIKFVRSTDGGVTWSAPIVLNSGHAGCDTGAYPVVASDGTIYVAWQDFGCINSQPGIEVTKSTDGGLTWTPFTTVSLAPFTQDNGDTAFCGRPALNGRIRITNFPAVGTNPTNGNEVYVTWNASPSGVDDADVFFSRSTDGGVTWSTPVRLNDDTTTSDQFMPALDVANDGTILIAWYDRREDVVNFNMRRWGGMSFDGGVSFTSNFPIGDALFPPAVNFDPNVSFCYMGDYDWITHDPASNFHLVWGDNRNTIEAPHTPGRHDPDIFYATFPTTGPGAILAFANAAFDDTGDGDGDGDNEPEPGETAEVTVTLRNLGTAAATGINATLSTTTPGVTVTQAQATYPDIPANGGTADNTTPFTVSIDLTVFLGTRAEFMLNVTTTTAGTFSLPFTVRLGIPPIIGFLYINDDGNPNTVSGFRVGADGTLIPLPGSPFPTGGTGNFGGFFAAPRIRAALERDFLYATNSSSGDISGFAIAADGTLTPVPGSPFPTGLFDPEGIAMNPASTCLFVGAVGQTGLTAFRINNDGSLSLVETESIPDAVDDLRVTPDGSLLVISLPGFDQIGVFAIDATCALTPVPGSPFPARSQIGIITGLEFNAAGDRLFGGIANFDSTVVSDFDFAGENPSHCSGSPVSYLGQGDNSNVVLLNPTNDKLFVTNQFSSSVSVLDVHPDCGVIPIAGSPFPVPGADFPTGVAMNPVGTLLFVAGGINAVYAYNVALDGSLTEVPESPFPTGASGFPFSLVFVGPSLPPCSQCQIEAGLIAGTDQGGPGSPITIPVEVRNAPNAVDALGFELRYDPSKLLFTGCDFTGTLLETWNQKDCSMPVSDIVRVGAFTTGTPIAAGQTGLIVKVRFEVLTCEEGEQFALPLQHFVDDVATWDTCNGCFTCGCPCDGDVDENNQVTPGDALIIFQCFLEIRECNPCEQDHGDITQDARLTPGDALCDFRQFLELPPTEDCVCFLE